MSFDEPGDLFNWELLRPILLRAWSKDLLACIGSGKDTVKINIINNNNSIYRQWKYSLISIHFIFTQIPTRHIRMSWRFTFILFLLIIYNVNKQLKYRNADYVVLIMVIDIQSSP